MNQEINISLLQILKYFIRIRNFLLPPFEFYFYLFNFYVVILQ